MKEKQEIESNRIAEITSHPDGRAGWERQTQRERAGERDGLSQISHRTDWKAGWVASG